MAINKTLKKSGYYGSATSNGKNLIKHITKRIREIDSYGDRLLEEVCKIFVQQAQSRLIDSGYNVGSLIKNIYYQKYGKNKYRVGIRNNNQKAIMYFLEFGTGIVGDNDPHEMANEVGWEYIIHPENLASNTGYKYPLPTGYNSLNEYVGLNGWYYTDPSTGQLKFTSGLKAVSYLYDTFREDSMAKIIETAKRRLNGTS